MNLLAIECSARVGSVALFSDDQLLAEESWDDSRMRNQQLLAVIPSVLKKTSIEAGDIDVYAVGRGPGNYSGLRIALSAAQAMALPGHDTVHAVSSGEALAREVAGAHSAPSIAVLGDARRQKLWLGVFDIQEDVLRVREDWTLVEADSAGKLIPDDALLISPDWQRLGPIISESGLGGNQWIPEDCYPTARGVGALTIEHLRRGCSSAPLEPLYMHPAV